MSTPTNHALPTPRTADHALILGGTGAAGAAIASRLARSGVRVTLAGRGSVAPRLDAYPDLAALPWRQVDLRQPGALRQAARDGDVIVHAANPASYVDWPREVLPMMDAVLDAVAHPEVTVMLPGNVYALTPGPSPISEDVPARDGAENATNAKGRLRHTLEARLQSAAQAGQCRALVVRAGDFFGAHAPRGWIAQAMLPALNRPEWPAVPGSGVPPTVRRIWQPGAAGVGHQWNYLDDYAHTVALLLAERARLPRWAAFHTTGHWDADGQTLVARTADLLGQATGHRPRAKAFPWWAMRLGAPFHAMSREVLDMRWLWQQPVRLSNAKLRAFLQQDEPHTAWDAALRASLRIG